MTSPGRPGPGCTGRPYVYLGSSGSMTVKFGPELSKLVSASLLNVAYAYA